MKINNTSMSVVIVFCQNMKGLILVVIWIILTSCSNENTQAGWDQASIKTDSLALANMIAVREKAMINRDLDTALEQFSDHATWINSQGYYFKGKENIRKFHAMLTGNDSLDYYYVAGNPRIRNIDPKNALAYYGWKMFWFKKDNPADTTFKEIGLMTLTAHKADQNWKWIAVSNQHTPWFYKDIEPVLTD